MLVEDVATGERQRVAADFPAKVGQEVVVQGRRWRIVAGDHLRPGAAVGSWDPGPMADHDDLADSFPAPVDEAFRRLLDEPDAHLPCTPQGVAQLGSAPAFGVADAVRCAESPDPSGFSGSG